MEIEALETAQGRVNEAIVKAALTILSTRGKIILLGVGKSGQVARKIASTLSSTGSPAVFINAAEAAHGDIGVLQREDLVIVVSNSGTTMELVQIVPVIRSFGPQIIGIIGNINSPLASQMDLVIDARVAHEADVLDTIPTSSTTLAMVIGDALASVLMLARGFTRQQYLVNHPAGHLGRNLMYKVGDIMRVGQDIPTVSADTPLLDVLLEASSKHLGGVCVVNQEQKLMGIILDGDIRRYIQMNRQIEGIVAQELLNPTPLTLSPEDLLIDAERIMGQPSCPRAFVPIILEDHRLLGVLWYYDLISSEKGTSGW